MQTLLKKHSLDLMFILSIYALAPLYLLPSGSVQVVDIAIVGMIIITAINIGVSEFRKSFRHVAPFMPFMIWTIIVNICYTLVSNHIEYMIASVELIYTLAIVVFVSILLKRIIASSRHVNFLLYTLLVSCIAAMVVPSSTEPFSTRVQLSFNNPNQLAYFALLILTSLMIINDVLIKKYNTTSWNIIMTIVVTMVADIFAFISASRAGLVSCAMVNIFILYIYIKHNAMRTLIVVAITSGMVLIILSNVGRWHFLSRSINDATDRFTRVKIIDQSNLDNRWFGYLDYKGAYSIIFGDGGRYRREPEVIREKIIDKEVHNAILWNFLAYGIIGGLLFLAGAAGFYRQMKLPDRFIVLLPVVIFNMTLYGLRFRFFWMTMALLCAASSLYSVRDRENTGSLKPHPFAEREQ